MKTIRLNGKVYSACENKNSKVVKDNKKYEHIDIKIKILGNLRFIRPFDFLALFGISSFLYLKYDVLSGLEQLNQLSMEKCFLVNSNRRIIVNRKLPNGYLARESIRISLLDYKKLKEGDIIHIYDAVMYDQNFAYPKIHYDIIKDVTTG